MCAVVMKKLCKQNLNDHNGIEVWSSGKTVMKTSLWPNFFTSYMKSEVTSDYYSEKMFTKDQKPKEAKPNLSGFSFDAPRS